jgi:hypothetical protein
VKTGRGKLDNTGAWKAVRRVRVVYHAGRMDFNQR